MKFQQTAHDTTAHDGDGAKHEGWRNLMIVAIGTTGMIALAVGAMALLTSPDGWVMKAANQAMTTAHEGTLASYTLSDMR